MLHLLIHLEIPELFNSGLTHIVNGYVDFPPKNNVIVKCAGFLLYKQPTPNLSCSRDQIDDSIKKGLTSFCLSRQTKLNKQISM